MQRSSSNVVFLTQVGGGAFGNDDAWVQGALRRALGIVKDMGLDVRVVSYGTPSAELVRLASEYLSIRLAATAGSRVCDA